MSRDRMSLPSASVPKRWAADGGAQRSSRLIALGSSGRSRGEDRDQDDEDEETGAQGHDPIPVAQASDDTRAGASNRERRGDAHPTPTTRTRGSRNPFNTSTTAFKMTNVATMINEIACTTAKSFAETD